MPDKTFEMELEDRFAAAPALPDADLFAARVLARVDRGWAFRRMVIGGLGVVGGLVGAGQLLGSGLVSRLGSLGEHSEALLRSALASVPAARQVSELVSLGSTQDGQVLWMSATLAAVAVGLFVTRALREL